MSPPLYADAVLALVDLANRAGARDFEFGWDCPHTPDIDRDHHCDQATWHAVVSYHGARLIADEHRTPTGAAMALAERLLAGGTCRCRQPVALSDDQPGCRWRLAGQRWEPGCHAPSVHVAGGKRGDLAALQTTLAQPTNREQRRAARRGKRGAGSTS